MKSIIEQWLSDQCKPIEATDKFWDRTAICEPRISESPYVKTNDSIKTKVNGITFRYKIYSPMPQTKTYDVVFKQLKH